MTNIYEHQPVEEKAFDAVGNPSLASKQTRRLVELIRRADPYFEFPSRDEHDQLWFEARQASFRSAEMYRSALAELEPDIFDKRVNAIGEMLFGGPVD